MIPPPLELLCVVSVSGIRTRDSQVCHHIYSRHRLNEVKSSEDQTEPFFSFFESERKHFELDANFFDAAAAFDGFRLIDRKWKVDQQSLFSNQSLVNDDPDSTGSSHFLNSTMTV